MSRPVPLRAVAGERVPGHGGGARQFKCERIWRVHADARAGLPVSCRPGPAGLTPSAGRTALCDGVCDATLLFLDRLESVVRYWRGV